MKTHKWNDVKRRLFSPEKLQQLEVETAAEILEMNLSQIREAAGLTQVEMAGKMELVQSSIARMEQKDNDPRLSTLRRFVRAIGGEVRVQAVLKNGKIVELAV